MSVKFKRIGLFAKHNTRSVAETFQQLICFLESHAFQLTIEEQSASLLDEVKAKVKPKEAIPGESDLIIVVGGDGSLLNAARVAADGHVPVLGINRGRLGFLADISPDEIQVKLTEIFAGKYKVESRSLLHTSITRNDKEVMTGTALNDIVLYNSDVARMIEFEVYIDGQFMLRQRSDGLITATPTGSTAYALSGGGPILTPSLNALVLVPMFPHTLSSRPIVIDDNSVIELVVTHHNQVAPRLSCDGQEHLDLDYGDHVIIKKHDNPLSLVHPEKINYFEVLREKLGWNSNITSDRYATSTKK